MGRPGIEPHKIREVISGPLESEGTAVSVTPIRERLGSGSYSTIGVVLAAWRKEQAEAVLPTCPRSPSGSLTSLGTCGLRRGGRPTPIMSRSVRRFSGSGLSMSSCGRRWATRSLGLKRSCRGLKPSGVGPGRLEEGRRGAGAGACRAGQGRGHGADA